MSLSGGQNSARSNAAGAGAGAPLSARGGAKGIETSALGPKSVARVKLGPRLAGLPPAFFPLNSNVLAVAGPSAARLIMLEPILAGHVLRQSDIDLSVLRDGEALTTLSWAASGALLLGTTAGRVLTVPGR